MNETIFSRGPDSGGIWLDKDMRAGLAARRLAILDLSPAGQQPMISADSRYTISYNGEIYNYRSLRKELESRGSKFLGQSDTEVLLEACRVWGAEVTARRLNGIFAFALWDAREATLTLVRDPLGVKPLYWGAVGDTVVFGSQLKALRPFLGEAPAIAPEGLNAFFQLGYIPAPQTIYRGIKKVMPGGIVIWKHGRAAREEIYWDIVAMAMEGRAQGFDLTPANATDALEALLKEAVRDQMVSDVPLGAFLSGGIDSSTITALMQSQHGARVKTFSIGFTDKHYDESTYARAVARHLGTEHHELIVEPAQAMEVIPHLPEWFDEPFADPSQIPTYLLSQMTRREVTVALSGDGGDELFAGYPRYSQALYFRRMTQWLPGPARAAGAQALRLFSHILAKSSDAPTPDYIRFNSRIQKAADLLSHSSLDATFTALVTHWRTAPLRASLPGHPFDNLLPANLDIDQLSRMQLLESLTWLPEDVLAKVDRASMAVSLEARVPLLDTRIVAFAWRLPREMKLRDGRGKFLLREVLARYVPPALTERPKKGFGVPIATWLRGPLREWAEELLDEKRLEVEGILDACAIRERWHEHQSGIRDWQLALWDVLMFQAWNYRWRREPVSQPCQRESGAAIGYSSAAVCS